MGDRPGPAGAGALVVRALLSSALVALGLAGWNAAQGLVVSEAYRLEPRRALGLLAAAAIAYLPLVVAVVLPAGLLPALRRRRLEGADPRALVTGAAAGAAAAWIAVGYFAGATGASRAAGAGVVLDAGAAALVALAAGRLAWRASRRARAGAAAGPFHAGLSVVIALHAAVLAWAMIRGSHGRAFSAVAAAAAGAAAGAALLLVGLARRRRASARRMAAGSALVIALLAGGLLSRGDAGARAEAATASGTRGGPNVLVLVADALRADHVGAYGAARTRTPSIDGLAARGARVRRAYATASGTAASTASILTGLHPSRHGLRTQRDRIAPGADGLGGALGAAGWRSAGFAANPALSRRLGFGAGFPTWDADLETDRLAGHPGSPIAATLSALRLWSPPQTLPAAEIVVARALAWIDASGTDPFLLYLQLADPHDPYAPPHPYDRMYLDPGVEPFPMSFGTLSQIEQGRRAVAAGDLARLLGAYAGAVTYMDAQIGRLLAGLEARGLLDGTLIVVTSSHGEEFNDHAGLGHEQTLYEEVIRVPMIVAGPGVAPGRVVEGPASLVDVAPTILDAAGLAVPSSIDGESLWPALRGGAPPPPRIVVAEQTYVGIRSPWHALRAVLEGPFKLIGRSFHANGSGPWSWELYDLDADPAERRDLAAERPEAADALRLRLESWSRRPGAVGAPPAEAAVGRLRPPGRVP